MDQHQPCQESKLTKGIVCRHSSLATFLTNNTDTNVSSLNHRNIVSTITNGKSHDIQRITDQFDHFGLLGWRNTATENSFTLLTQQQKHTLEVLVLKDRSECTTINYNSSFRCWDRMILLSMMKLFFRTSE